MSPPQLYPALHWLTFWRTMAVEGIGLFVLGMVYVLAVGDTHPLAGTVVLCFANAVPCWLAGWLVFNLVFLIGLRPRKRFVLIRWCVLAWMRLCVALASFLAAYPSDFNFPPRISESSYVLGSAALLAVISTTVYSLLHRSARESGSIGGTTRTPRQALMFLVFGELALVSAIAVMGEGYDLEAWQVTAHIIVGAWLPGWLALLLWQRARKRRGLQITQARLLMVSFVRACFGTAIYLYGIVGILDHSNEPLSWRRDLALPVAYSALLAAVLVTVPSVGYLRLTKKQAMSRAGRARMRGGFSITAVFAAAGTELFLIMLSHWHYMDYLARGRDYESLSHQRFALALMPFLAWLLIRTPILLRSWGWKRLGLPRFLAINAAVSAFSAIAVHFFYGPSELRIGWLLAMATFGMIAGLAYILDCKLRAVERLPS